MKEFVLSSRAAFRLRSDLGRRVHGCFLCKWILQDLTDHGKLTGWPYDYNDKPNFPPESKLAHLEVERISIDNVPK